MIVHGITLDFDDIKTCGLLPDLCANWDRRSEELVELETIAQYWDENIKILLKQTKKLIIGNIGNKSIVYSYDKDAILKIKETFKEFTLTQMEYKVINHDIDYIVHDYLKFYVV